MLLFFLAGSVALQVWAWRALVRRVHTGTLSRLGAAGRYALWAFLPALLPIAVFFAGVGLEEWLGMAVISESWARATPLMALVLFALASLVWIGFAVRCALLRRERP